MCGSTSTAVLAFLAMWSAMTAAMMTHSIAPRLWRYHRAVAVEAVRPGLLTSVAGLAYFAVWLAAGLVVLGLRIALQAAESHLSWVLGVTPLAAALMVLAAGGLQLTRWKAHRLACCRIAPTGGPHAVSALRHGLRLGRDCCACCAPLMAVLLALGLMDLRLMALATVVITAERLAPTAERIAQAAGILALGAGAFLLAKAVAAG